jgi:hypothetical protein
MGVSKRNFAFRYDRAGSFPLLKPEIKFLQRNQHMSRPQRGQSNDRSSHTAKGGKCEAYHLARSTKWSNFHHKSPAQQPECGGDGRKDRGDTNGQSCRGRYLCPCSRSCREALRYCGATQRDEARKRGQCHLDLSGSLRLLRVLIMRGTRSCHCPRTS